MALQTGQKAPSFTLPTATEEGKTHISLEDYRGQPVVLLFFPFAFTGVCTNELCTVSEGLEAYGELNAAVLGISVDSRFTQKAWAEANNITVPLLSDFDKEVITAYDVKYDEFAGYKSGVAKRSAFVVDGEGIIRYASSSDDASVLPDFDEIRNVLLDL